MSVSIAVVIPAFNSAETVTTAIDSALRQHRPPDEVIVVDDGSTDATAERVKRFSDAVTLIQQPNQGSSVARQTGTDAAASEYVAYLDADDWWPDDKLAVCAEILAAHSVHFLLADLQRGQPGDEPSAYLPRNSTFFPWTHKFFRAERRTGDNALLFELPPNEGLALLLCGFPVFPSTMLANRDAIVAVGGWDSRFKRCQDFDIGLKLAQRYPLFYLDRVQAILGLHGGNDEVNAYLIKQTQGDIRVLEAHAAETADPAYRSLVTRALSRKLCALGYVHRKTGEPRLARAAYGSALSQPGRRLHALTRWALTWMP